MKKCIDKNKIYNKLKNTKISFADSSFSRKMGLRKFYKQKNLVENKWYRFIFYVYIKIYLYMLVDLILLCNIKIT